MSKENLISKLNVPKVRKKLGTLIVGVLLLVANDWWGLGIDESTAQWPRTWVRPALMGTYFLGQGLADMGKESAPDEIVVSEGGSNHD